MNSIMRFVKELFCYFTASIIILSFSGLFFYSISGANEVSQILDTSHSENQTEVQEMQIKSLENQDPNQYIIGVEDQLHISVWKDEHLTKQVIVRPDGKISFPLIGDVLANDRTPEELRQEITQKIRKFIPDAVVTIMVLKINSIKIYVIGNVNRTGEFVLGKRINVLQALSIAGGLNPFASSKKVFIIRTRDSEQIKIPFNYKEVIKGNNLEQNIYLQSGDIIVVP